MTVGKFGCGLEAVLDLVSGKWKLLVLFHLNGTRLRFGELRRALGSVSEKMLSQQLQQLVADGLITRIDHRTVPPRVEYELTPFGRSLSEALRPLCQWGTNNMDKIGSISRSRATSSQGPQQENPNHHPKPKSNIH